MQTRHSEPPIELTDADMLDITEAQALEVLASSDPFQTAPRATAQELAAL